MNDDFDLRQFVLQLANNCPGESVEQVIAKAEAYLAFMVPPPPIEVKVRKKRRLSPAARKAASERFKRMHAEGKLGRGISGRKPRLAIV